MKKYLLLSGLLLLLFSACKKNDFKPATQATIDDDKIKAYIAANNIPATKGPGGVYYQILVAGTGTLPNDTSHVKVTYSGKLLNGTTFQDKQTSTLSLTSTITGWAYGIPLVGTGGRIRLIIPSGLGYGKDGSSAGLTPVPSNAILDFTIDLLGFY